MGIIIKNGIIVNSDDIADSTSDILLEHGKIIRISRRMKTTGHDVIDVAGKLVLPGLIDCHVHLRQPGREDKETIETGAMAAAKGGFTTIMCMPNTTPVLDNEMIIEAVKKEAARVGVVNVLPVGSITKGMKGEQLTDMYELRAAGCVALSDDGRCVFNSQLMYLAMQYAKPLGLLLVEHCQDEFLSNNAVMNEGFYSTLLGLKGDPAVAETVIVARDIELARYLDVKIHFQHISLNRSVELISRAKQDGVKVTAEACPHHFTLTDKDVSSFDTNTKVYPPLRTDEDVDAIKKGLQNGVIDCIASDHAPHTVEEKEKGFAEAPFGMIGLETSLGLVMTELVDKGIISLTQMVDKMSTSPARIFGLETKGVVKEGYDADITIIDPEAEWEVKAEEFMSKSKNSPFIGRRLKGKVDMTICKGKVVYRDYI